MRIRRSRIWVLILGLTLCALLRPAAGTSAATAAAGLARGRRRQKAPL